MDNDNLNVSHLAWCGLIALHTARRDGLGSGWGREAAGGSEEYLHLLLADGFSTE